MMDLPEGVGCLQEKSVIRRCVGSLAGQSIGYRGIERHHWEKTLSFSWSCCRRLAAADPPPFYGPIAAACQLTAFAPRTSNDRILIGGEVSKRLAGKASQWCAARFISRLPCSSAQLAPAWDSEKEREQKISAHCQRNASAHQAERLLWSAMIPARFAKFWPCSGPVAMAWGCLSGPLRFLKTIATTIRSGRDARQNTRREEPRI
ncbi:hypothetical protein VTI74DRAFT_10212 [Chaetomium olivicolor]